MKNYTNFYSAYSRRVVEDFFAERHSYYISRYQLVEYLQFLGYYESEEKLCRVLNVVFGAGFEQVDSFGSHDFQRICYIIYASGSYHDAVMRFFSMDHYQTGRVTLDNALRILLNDATEKMDSKRIECYRAATSDLLRVIDVEEFLLLESGFYVK